MRTEQASWCGLSNDLRAVGRVHEGTVAPRPVSKPSACYGTHKSTSQYLPKSPCAHDLCYLRWTFTAYYIVACEIRVNCACGVVA